MEGEIDLVRILDAFVHGVWLPPGSIVIIIVVGEERGRVVAASADFAWLLLHTRLLAELDGTVLAARVRRLHQHVESSVFERRYTSLKYTISRDVYSIQFYNVSFILISEYHPQLYKFIIE